MRTAQKRKTPARNNGTPRKVVGRSRTPRKGHEKMARNRRIHAFTAASPPNRTPPLPTQDHLLYYQKMKRKKRPWETAILALWLFGGILAFSPILAPPAAADIYRWEDESGVIHFTDDPSTIPAKYRGKSREILRTPPAAGKPSVSTMGAPSSPPGPSLSPRPSNGVTLDRPSLPQDDDATLAEKLRAKIDAKERFIRAVDEKQSLATNPYRNRFVSPSDLELSQKYKEELPGDWNRLKALESRLSPVKEP
jgi:Domain of unknown function (DUF4124)